MHKSIYILFAALFATMAAEAQLSKTDSLFIALKNQDSVFFERAFNRCDIDYLENAIHPDLLFFHDQGGIQKKADFLAAVKNNICANPDQKPIRKVDAGSLNVFPLYNDGRLYGVIQTGVHDFYIREKGREDRHTSQAKFTHVWLLENGHWLLKEVLSFDHQDPAKGSTALSFEEELKQLMEKEQVPALGIGIIENGRLKQIQVIGNRNADTPAAYNAVFKVASLTKPVTALVTLKLISAGRLGLDEPLYKYWIDPDLRNDKRVQRLTPRIILSHQTGFPNWRYLNATNKLAFEFDPGTRYQYSGEGFEYLRRALESKFGKSLETLAAELVFRPAGMTDTHFYWDNKMDESRYVRNFDSAGHVYPLQKYYKANAAANLLTTVADYGNFLVYILNGAGLTPSVLAEMQKSQVQLKENDYFGLGWEKLTGFPNDEYALLHTGSDPGVSTAAIIFPRSKNGWLIFLNGDNDMKLIEKLLTEKLYFGKELWEKK